MVTFQLKFAPVHVKVESFAGPYHNRVKASFSVFEYLCRCIRKIPRCVRDCSPFFILKLGQHSTPGMWSTSALRHVLQSPLKHARLLVWASSSFNFWNDSSCLKAQSSSEAIVEVLHASCLEVWKKRSWILHKLYKRADLRNILERTGNHDGGHFLFTRCDKMAS